MSGVEVSANSVMMVCREVEPVPLGGERREPFWWLW